MEQVDNYISLIGIVLCIVVFISVGAIWLVILQKKIYFCSKYTYEEYKAKMDEKKALKQAHKKEKLKQKLNELEKGE